MTEDITPQPKDGERCLKDGIDKRGVFLLRIIEKLLPTLTLVVGGCWALYTYTHHDRVERDKDERTRRFEVQKPFLTKQSDLYFETAKVVGELLTLPAHEDAWNMARARFMGLYWSELSMVETPGVEECMVRFRTSLDRYADAEAAVGKKNPDSALNHSVDVARADAGQAAYSLAHEIRTAIRISWNLEPIPQTQAGVSGGSDQQLK